MSTIVGILTFMSMIHFMLSLVERSLMLDKADINCTSM